ncbi:ParB-like partition protein [Rhizobium phage vB_RleS_L338C]|uniref:ParB-like partition protein n=1 Tax=Rhizobium phage vB_RleS_L338C TaxID=1414737 RepID=UPI0003D8E498|nr:ParB-like partition protein [Rhizobium phage vB_RleS_L338C]AHC30507.1 co-activator of prophage gene expression IbrB [Rhizobium phage vB_RleS_L338C]QNH72092.1 co-activator of prophage gene expression [Rhizobium phage P11VFA]
MKLSDHPIANIQWVEVSRLQANDYNPNVVVTPEFKLLKFSLLKQGWIQPILACPVPGSDTALEIIDGFHRATLAKTDKEVSEMAEGKVPVSILSLDVAERKMLTIRINRAKGSHVAVKMHDIVVSLINDHGLSIKDVCQGIGADKSEVELLLTDNVFKKLDIENTPYSRAWEPNPK